MKRSIFAVFLIALSACAIKNFDMSYNMPLESVRRPADTQDRWGEYTIDPPSDSTGYTYSDDLITLAVATGAGAFQLYIENKSEHSIVIEWNDAAYVGPSGFTSGIATGDTRIIDLGRERPSQSVPAGSRIAPLVFPVEAYDARRRSLADFVVLDDNAGDLEGAEVRLILPLTVEGTTNEYTLLFRIQNVEFPWVEPDCTVARYRRGTCKQ